MGHFWTLEFWGPHWLARQAGLWPAGHPLHTSDPNINIIWQIYWIILDYNVTYFWFSIAVTSDIFLVHSKLISNIFISLYLSICISYVITTTCFKSPYNDFFPYSHHFYNITYYWKIPDFSRNILPLTDIENRPINKK